MAEKRGKGRPPVEFSQKDRDEIEHLAGLCMSQDEISLLKKCDRNTLAKHCAYELEVGKAKAKQMVVNHLFSSIKKGEVTSIYFYLKCQHKWKDRSEVELTGKDGESLINPGINISLLKKDK